MDRGAWRATVHGVTKSWTLLSISHASKEMLKILQARLQQYVNHELPDVQAVLEKAEQPEIKLPTSAGSSQKQGIQENNLLLFNQLCQSL